MRETRRGRRRSLRFRPSDSVLGATGSLEARRLLSHASPAIVRHAHPSLSSGAPGGRVGPSAEIHKQYNDFYNAFRLIEATYVRSLGEQSTGMVNVTTTLTAPYLAGTATMQVADAGVFGPEGTFSTPVIATAFVGNVQAGTFTITGSSGNEIVLNTTQSSAVSLNSGVSLAAQVTSTGTTIAQAIFPSYIVNSSQVLAINLVKYFNNLPIKLPRMYASPHYPQRSGAIQQYVYQVVASGTAASLEESLISIPLPQTPGGDLQIYDAAVKAAIFASRQRMLNGVQQIFANKYPVIPIGYGGTATGGTGTTGSTGSTTSAGSTGASTGTTRSSSNGVGSTGTNLSSAFVP